MSSQHRRLAAGETMFLFLKSTSDAILPTYTRYDDHDHLGAVDRIGRATRAYAAEFSRQASLLCQLKAEDAVSDLVWICAFDLDLWILRFTEAPTRIFCCSLAPCAGKSGPDVWWLLTARYLRDKLIVDTMRLAGCIIITASNSC